MDIASIDRSAIAGNSLLHAASAGAKLLAVALMLGGIIGSWNALVLAFLVLALVTAGLLSRLDMRLLLGLALYPALFAAVFAFASAPSVMDAVSIMLKAIGAGLVAILLVLTTPYPLVFSKIQAFVPGVVGDALLMTYRTFFLLAERFSELLIAVRLRSAAQDRGGPARAARMVSSALGNTVLYAFDLAERDYDVLLLRGYSGRLRAAPPAHRSPGSDLVVVAGASLLAATALVWRFGWRQLNPYSWLPLAVSAALLAAAIIWRWTRGARTQ